MKGYFFTKIHFFPSLPFHHKSVEFIPSASLFTFFTINNKNRKRFKSFSPHKMSQKINQKEYLKKYLSDPSDKKKRRKKEKAKTGQSLKIIDDADEYKQSAQYDDELEAALLMNDEAPQIVGVVDERPPELKALDYKNSRWKSLAEAGNVNQDETRKILKEELFAKKRGIEKKETQRRTSGDNSPPRRKKSPERRRERTPDISPPRKRERSLDNSPPRRRKSPDLSPKRKQKSPDNSPPRRRVPDLSPPRRRKTPDTSPPRKRERSRDISPPRRRKPSPDMSPVRQRRRRSPDNSPPRKRQSRSPRKSRWGEKSPSPLPYRKISPPSPPVRDRGKVKETKPARYKPTPSPPRRNQQESKPQRYKPTPSPPRSSKMSDGKRAGLQDADSLRRETEEHRRREAAMYENMSAEVSGRDQEARVRATGRVDLRKMKEDAKRKKEQEEKYEKRKEVYDKWGKGVKQVEKYNERLADAVHEASKPLARYANDEDLDSLLKKRELVEDPMLEYIRSKRKKDKIEKQVLEVPIYEGIFPDNRFNIRPGYRWDGVDRSNGFEKRLFENKNLREAAKEEAYLYSTEDM